MFGPKMTVKEELLQAASHYQQMAEQAEEDAKRNTEQCMRNLERAQEFRKKHAKYTEIANNH